MQVPSQLCIKLIRQNTNSSTKSVLSTNFELLLTNPLFQGLGLKLNLARGKKRVKLIKYQNSLSITHLAILMLKRPWSLREFLSQQAAYPSIGVMLTKANNQPFNH